MAVLIQSPAKCGVHSVIQFPNPKGDHPVDIHKQIVAVYGHVMNRQNVTKWCRESSEGRTEVHDKQKRSNRPSLISDNIPQKTEGEIYANPHGTIRELHHIIPEVSDHKS
jgi:hypothetical protein